LALQLGKEGSNEVYKLGERGIAKALGKQVFGKWLMKRIPIIGLGIGLYEAYNRFSNGNIIGGLLALASGVASTVPGLGTGISILIDAANAGLDYTYGGDKNVTKGIISSQWNKSLIKLVKKIPGLSSFAYLSESLGYFSVYDWKNGFKSMAMGLPFMPNIIDLLQFTDNKFKTNVVGNGKSLMDYIENYFKLGIDWILNKWHLPSMDELINGKKPTLISKEERELRESESFKMATPERQEERLKMLKIQPAKDLVIQQYTQPKKQSIQFQPSDQDRLYTVGGDNESQIHAQQGGVLDKTFKNMLEAIVAQTNVARESLKHLENMSKELEQIYGKNMEMVNILPSLQPIASTNNTTTFPNSDIRDTIHEYRGKWRV